MALLALVALSCTRSDTTFPRANLIIIGLDTFRADHLGEQRDGRTYSPRLQELATEAVSFENAYSTSSWTLPSFGSLFTGLLPSEHGAVGGPHHLGPDQTPLAEILKQEGYHTAGFIAVDWLSEEFGMDQGFDQQQSFVKGSVSTRFELYEDLVTEFQSSPPSEPYFLFVHIYDAHAPYEPPPPFDRMYYAPDPRPSGANELEFLLTEPNRTEKNGAELYAWLRGVEDADLPVAQYAAGVSYVDDKVGALLDALRQSGQLDDSIVVVVGDHGEHLTEHDLYFTHHFPYEETLHIPLMIRLPGQQWAGRGIPHEVSLIDVMPTLLELLDISSPPTSGVSLVELMADPKASLERRWLFAESGGPDRVRGVWNQRYRLLRFRNPRTDQSTFELYDREKDRLETVDLAQRMPELVSNLAAVLDARFQGLETPGQPLRQRPLSEEAEARLKALGYL